MLTTIIMISIYNNTKCRRWNDKECEKDLEMNEHGMKFNTLIINNFDDSTVEWTREIFNSNNDDEICSPPLQLTASIVSHVVKLNFSDFWVSNILTWYLNILHKLQNICKIRHVLVGITHRIRDFCLHRWCFFLLCYHSWSVRNEFSNFFSIKINRSLCSRNKSSTLTNALCSTDIDYL